MRTAPRPALVCASILLCLALGAGGCSGDEASGPDDSSSAAPLPTEAAPTFAIETHTTLGRVVGRLGRRDGKRLEGAVTEVVQRWFNAAFVGGDYPRGDFHDAFPGFTIRARAEARKDKRLLSNVGIGPRISDVTPKQSRVWLDVLAVRKRAVGVTARFLLRFRTRGDLERTIEVRGRLMLSHGESGWKIFGYDVATGGRA